MSWLTRKAFMTNDRIQLYVQDKVLAVLLLPLIPQWVHPNHITLFRIFLIPFNLYYLFTEQWSILLPLFIFTAFTDVVDGSLARVRRQITLWGSILDPTADKILIASVAGLFIVREVHHLLAFTIILFEFLIVFGAYSRRRRGEYISSNGSGKVKMFLQAVGFVFLLLAKVTGIGFFMTFGTGLLIVSLGFAMLSLVTYGL